MKIGILTQPLKSNYGGILQAYALQTTLERLGHETLVLRREYGSSKAKLYMFRMGSFVKCCVRKYIFFDKNTLICNPFTKGEYVVRKGEDFASKLLRFIHHNIRQTCPLYSGNSLRREIERQKLQCIVVGSDQVWREDYSPCITNYFLDFISDGKYDYVKKISYAASFGTSVNPISEMKLDTCIQLSKKFHSLSVREKSGVDYMRGVFSQQAELVLDPTLLLSKEDYLSLIESKDNQPSGIVSYILDENLEKTKILDDVCSVKSARHSHLTLEIYDVKGNIRQLESVSKWLASFANADFVVTDSFHGCVFSIIFQKNFIVIGNKDRGLDRFYSLLENFGLLDRLVLSYEAYARKKESLYRNIDYRKIGETHKELKEKSMNYLIESLK